MAIIVGSIVRFKCFGLQRAQQLLNVAYYEVTGISPGTVVTIPANLAHGYALKRFDTVKALTSSAYTFDRVEVDEINGPSIGTYSYVPGTLGSVSGDPLPTYVAVSTQLLRGDRTTRHGWQRLAGVPEAFNINGVLQPAQQAAWQSAMSDLFYPEGGIPTVEVDMIDSGEDPAGTVLMRAIIWGGNSPAFPTGRYQYVQGVDVKAELSTQNTRKIGRGA